MILCHARDYQLTITSSNQQSVHLLSRGTTSLMSSLESKVLQLQAILDNVVKATAVIAVCLIDARADRQEYIVWAGAEPPSKDHLATLVAEWINGHSTQAILGVFAERGGTPPSIMTIEFEAGTPEHSMKHVIRPLHDPASPTETRFVLAYAVPGDVSSGALRIHLSNAETQIKSALSLG